MNVRAQTEIGLGLPAADSNGSSRIGHWCFPSAPACSCDRLNRDGGDAVDSGCDNLFLPTPRYGRGRWWRHVHDRGCGSTSSNLIYRDRVKGQKGKENELVKNKCIWTR